MKQLNPQISKYKDASKLATIRNLIAGTVRGIVRLPLLSGSMAPTLLPGDTLLVRPLTGRHVHAGDVAVFLRDGKVTAHRLVFVYRFGTRAFLLEMGDANRIAAPIQEDAILGVVDSLERDGKRIFLAGEAGSTESRREACRLSSKMLWRYIATVLPLELLKKAVRK